MDEEGSSPAGGERRCDQAGAQCPEPLEPAEPFEQMLERVDAVAQPGGFFVAETLGQVGQAFAKTGERPAGEERPRAPPG